MTNIKQEVLDKWEDIRNRGLSWKPSEDERLVDLTLAKVGEVIDGLEELGCMKYEDISDDGGSITLVCKRIWNEEDYDPTDYKERLDGLCPHCKEIQKIQDNLGQPFTEKVGEKKKPKKQTIQSNCSMA